MQKGGMHIRLLAVVTTLLVLFLLIIAGPANAFSLNIFVSNTTPNIGDTVSFTTTLDIESGERLPVEFLTLNLFGPVNISCEFNPDGSVISGCDNIQIQPFASASFTNGNRTEKI